MELTQDYAQAKAQNWVDAWNSRDLDGVMAHYSENVAVCSPLVARRFPQSNGWIKGKSALRDYFSVGMGNPDLRFTLHSVLLGHHAMSIVYLRENDIRVVDTMELDENGLTARMIACYSGGNTRV